MRLHGDREPRQPQVGETGGAHCCSGAANEVWSYGDEVYDICCKYMNIREKMRDYTRGLMKEAHDKGTPIMRTLFYEFPEDEKSWKIEDEYLYGSKYLVAPVLQAGLTERNVYLPQNATWKDVETGEIYAGGIDIVVNAPVSVIPVFERIK